MAIRKDQKVGGADVNCNIPSCVQATRTKTVQSREGSTGSYSADYLSESIEIVDADICRGLELYRI